MIRDTRMIRISVTLALLLLFLAVMFFYGLADTAYAPFSVIGSDYVPDDDPGPSFIIPVPSPTDAPPPIPSPTPLLPTPTQEQPDSDYVLLRMRLSDISRGSLILVNHSHSFELPGDNDLIAIADHISSSYSLAFAGAQLSAMVIDPLNEMMDAFYAETGNSSLVIRSAYRSRAGQQQIYENYVGLVGYTEAQRWASLPGHSEHQAGVAVDLGRRSGGEIQAFSGAGIYSWFNENCYKFGFILRYPPDKTEITQIHHEPWHFRYVGIPHAYIMHSNNWCLEEYIELIMGHTRETPFVTEYGGVPYEIYFSRDVEIQLPFNSEFDVSGNNINGFIVTISTDQTAPRSS